MTNNVSNIPQSKGLSRAALAGDLRILADKFEAGDIESVVLIYQMRDGRINHLFDVPSPIIAVGLTSNFAAQINAEIGGYDE